MARREGSAGAPRPLPVAPSLGGPAAREGRRLAGRGRHMRPDWQGRARRGGHEALVQVDPQPGARGRRDRRGRRHPPRCHGGSRGPRHCRGPYVRGVPPGRHRRRRSRLRRRHNHRRHRDDGGHRSGLRRAGDDAPHWGGARVRLPPGVEGDPPGRRLRGRDARGPPRRRSLGASRRSVAQRLRPERRGGEEPEARRVCQGSHKGFPARRRGEEPEGLRMVPLDEGEGPCFRRRPQGAGSRRRRGRGQRQARIAEAG
mmetsp:Transcript_11656/g.27696  ORF Transcript_11656/g.27696 Transcript_11656/m.27696 type:complete len:257 (-) Transcript_11656:661-1431(-)